MRTCSWWAILTARITIRTASHRRRPAQAIMSRRLSGTRGLRERCGPGDVRISPVRRERPGHGRPLRALGRPVRIRFVTDLPRVIDRDGPIVGTGAGSQVARWGIRHHPGCAAGPRAGIGESPRSQQHGAGEGWDERESASAWRVDRGRVTPWQPWEGTVRGVTGAAAGQVDPAAQAALVVDAGQRQPRREVDPAAGSMAGPRAGIRGGPSPGREPCVRSACRA
jgi:hypothetical protein